MCDVERNKGKSPAHTERRWAYEVGTYSYLRGKEDEGELEGLHCGDVVLFGPVQYITRRGIGVTFYLFPEER